MIDKKIDEESNLKMCAIIIKQIYRIFRNKKKCRWTEY